MKKGIIFFGNNSRLAERELFLELCKGDICIYLTPCVPLSLAKERGRDKEERLRLS